MKTLSLATLMASVALPALAAVPVVGSSNVVNISGPLKLPTTTPCRVPLYGNVKFGANPVDFGFTPPKDCKGPWAMVVLQATTSLNAGRQFDRTATITLGGVNIMFGTTAEPRAALGPSWTIQKDVTEYSALFHAPQGGQVLIVNYQDSTYTSTITTGATLLFYPADAANPAPAVPDEVIPIAADAAGDTAALGSTSAMLSKTLTFPTNVLKARLDLYTQSQSGDEFWYTCVANNLATRLENCGGGSFREGEVAIDGTPAGVTPVYPWIYTGGIDPYLWEPLPGVQTLDFKPERVDLTPFAGLLDDGQPHTVSISVYGANNYFSAVGTLFLTLDPHQSKVSGSVTMNTLALPAPVTAKDIQGSGDDYTAVVTEHSAHDWQIAGTVTGSAGTVTTAITGSTSFINRQTYDLTDTIYDQKVYQDTVTNIATDITQNGTTKTETLSEDYPLQLVYDYTSTADGFSQSTSVNQDLQTSYKAASGGKVLALDAVRERLTPSDVLVVGAAGVTHTGAGKAVFHSVSSVNGCTERAAASMDSVLSYFAHTDQCDPALTH